MADLFSPDENDRFQAAAMSDMRIIAGQISTWLRFLSIVFIFIGALLTFTIVALPVAVVQIWLGIVLFQAAERAVQAQKTGDLAVFAALLDKMKRYFVLSSALLIVSIAFIATGIFFAEEWVGSLLGSVLAL
ncbi:MAG: DUF5362 family protein [Calditrichia bacterium]|nr:hypothetical protein [Calditrichota bacterium]MCB0270408.1 hypothetical protein [Calditrichota bacterium]MCB0285352.1 hypothetical protein [Calditrichota bacterium]MCB9068477.1 hypothetical protein [Calditrichia bacterium]